MKILFDTNVILDALQGRDPWKKDAEALILGVAEGKITGYITARQLCDIWYLAKQIHKGEDNAQKRAQKYISDLCKLFIVLDTTSEDIMNAISLDIPDFEDAVLVSSGKREEIDGIVTRNIKDFPKGFTNSTFYSPEELSKIIYP